MNQTSTDTAPESGRPSPDVQPGGFSAAALANARKLGLPALAEILTRFEDAVAIVDRDRRYVYVNPAACELFDQSVDQLRGRDLLDSFEAGERATLLDHLPSRLGHAEAPFTCVILGPDGAERDIVCLAFAVEMQEALHCVIVFREMAASRAAARAAATMVQMTAQLAAAETTTNEILAEIARHAVEGTRAISAGIMVADDDRRLSSWGGYGSDHLAHHQQPA